VSLGNNARAENNRRETDFLPAKAKALCPIRYIKEQEIEKKSTYSQTNRLEKGIKLSHTQHLNHDQVLFLRNYCSLHIEITHYW
jgi:hypothetical protein